MNSTNRARENLADKKLESRQSRVFGLSLGGGLILVGSWPFLLHGGPPRVWAVVCGLLLMLAGLIVPQRLRLVRRGWMSVVEGMGWLVTRVSLVLVYYGLIVPFGMGMRLIGCDPMNRKFEPAVESYRVRREARPASHLRHQF